MQINDTITAVEGVKVGHAQSDRARTGCSAILFSPPAIVACDARGGWPGTYDTHSIDVAKKYVRKHAIFLTGGDVFGFDSAIGIREFLLEEGEASIKGAGELPGIVGANIYDIEFANIKQVDYKKLGFQACRTASSKPVKEGNVGAGIGATVGKFKGMEFATKGGCGVAARTLKNGLAVGAIVITNAVGNIVDPNTGSLIAGARDSKGQGFVPFEKYLEPYLGTTSRRTNTTIGVVATNATLSHEQIIKVAELAHDGLAISIQPVHTLRDGDTLFAVSTERWDKNHVNGNDSVLDVVGYLATKCVAEAVVRSVKAAKSLGGIPSCTEFLAEG
jgi:L-aminopeptidase/D-esterase-like protein